MVRNRHGPRKIGKTDEDTMKEAVRNVVNGMSIRRAAATFDIKNGECITFDDSDEEEEQLLEELELLNPNDINVNDFVLVKFFVPRNHRSCTQVKFNVSSIKMTMIQHLM